LLIKKEIILYRQLSRCLKMGADFPMGGFVGHTDHTLWTSHSLQCPKVQQFLSVDCLPYSAGVVTNPTKVVPPFNQSRGEVLALEPGPPEDQGTTLIPVQVQEIV